MQTKLIPAEQWKKLRNNLAKKAKRSLHVMESEARSSLNKNEDFVRRYDYILTPAEVVTLVEMVMTETEQACERKMMLRELEDAD